MRMVRLREPLTMSFALRCTLQRQTALQLKLWAHRLSPRFSPNWDFFKPWVAQSRTIKGYWAIYGGFKALAISPYFQIAVLLSLICLAFWSKNDKMEHVIKGSEISIGVLPNLLGFTVG